MRLEKVARSLGRERQQTVVFADRVGILPKGTLLRYRESDSRRELTLKGKKRNAGLDKTREEWNVELGEGPMFEVLAAIGLLPETRYVKDTARYELAGVVVSVDQLEGVGHFCEIEAHDFSTDLDAVASVLELDPVTFEARGYPSIAAEAAEARQRNGATGARTRRAGNGQPHSSVK